MGGTSFSLFSASDHHHETFSFFFPFFLCWPGFTNCTLKAKNKANYGPKEIKDRLWVLKQYCHKQEIGPTWAKEKRANYELKWA
jgi:hypothetical protein